MSQKTEYKRSFTSSVAAGMSSIFNGRGKNYYILEHKVSSQYHKAGDSQEIIVDQIELGRDAKCVVRYDESFTTVSRRHAAIVRDGDNWKLVQLSQTNTTFLNGQPISSEWYLQNGDEIQLAVNGPKLGFLIPQGDKAKTGSIALSHRLSLFRQQALQPYKTAMWIMAGIMLLIVFLGGWFMYQQHKDKEMLEASIRMAEEKRVEDSLRNVRIQDSVQVEIRKIKKEADALKKKIKALPSVKTSSQTTSTVSPTVTNTSTGLTSLDACAPNVYFVYISKIVLQYDGQSKTITDLGSGTGFLLSDGRFVTARHVVEPWLYPASENDTTMILCNLLAYNGGKVTCYLDAYSPSGKHIQLKSTQAIINRHYDSKESIDGMVLCSPTRYDLDWAYFNTSETDGLSFNKSLSSSLPLKAELSILGYPMGIGANSATDIYPIYAQAIVAKEGLEQGLILTTSTTFEQGNSGGPVFVENKDNGEFIVVGLVSAGAGRSTGFVVPISAIK